MAKETEEHNSEASASSIGADPAAVAVALSGASRTRADTFLEKQSALTDLQIEDLKREDRLRHWSLRVRHISDVLKVAFEIAIAFIVVSIAAGIGAAIWTASRDDGLVIESFSVPPDMAARGLSGEVVAGQLLDKLVQMQAATGSNRPAKSYANNWGNDIKVQIPDTGVSAGEAYRFLSQWLGHQTHISGDLFRTADSIALTVRVAGGGGASFSGAETDLDALEQKAAEQVYARTQPYRYAIYEVDRGNVAQARKVLRRLVATGPVMERAWAEVGLGTLEENEAGGDEQAARRDYRAAVGDAQLTIAYADLAYSESALGHDEASLAATRELVSLNARGLFLNPGCAAVGQPLDLGIIAAAFGDFRDAMQHYAQAARLSGCPPNSQRARVNEPIALALQHDGAAARAVENAIAEPSSDGTNRVNAIEGQQEEREAELWLDFALADWPAVKNAAAAYAKLLPTLGGSGTMAYRTLGVSTLAIAMARTGDVPAAEAAISATPRDCYFCVRARGQIAALGKHWADSGRWFVAATRLAPSLPSAWSEWGEMLLLHGDYDGAIAKLEEAHKKGPHFADPLELWGEALMAKNRSDLALAKFEEANKYAPRWGRLHLKWGKALAYLGRKDEARSQYAIDSSLDLSATDKAELKRVSANHG